MKKNIFKMNKLKIKLLALLVPVLLVLQTGFSTNNSLAAENEINIDKRVVSYNEVDNSYNIELSVKGEKQIKENVVDIVLCIDTSSSMNAKKGTPPNEFTRLDKVKEAVKKFCADFVDTKTGLFYNGVRIGICDFNHKLDLNNVQERNDYLKINDNYYKAGNIKGGSSNDAQVVCNFTNNLDSINSAVDNLVAASTSGTNIQAGIECAGNMFEENATKKYIILFTDGEPTVSNNHWLGEGHKSVYKKKGNKYVYDKDVEGLAYLSSSGWQPDVKNWISDVHFTEAQRQYNTLLASIPATFPEIAPKYTDDELKFYVVADITDLNKRAEGNNGDIDEPYDYDSSYGKAFRLLNSINNTGGMKEIIDDNTIPTVFDEIARIIENESGIYILLDGVIKDKVPKEFMLPTVEELTLQLNDEITSGIIKNISVNSNTREITFELGDVDDVEIKFSYKLKPSNEYFYGYDVPTNTEAKIFYDDPDSTPKEQTFPVPKVIIEPKVCNLEIEKKIFDSTGNIELKPDYMNGTNVQLPYSGELIESYPILLKGDNGSYNFNIDFDFKSLPNDVDLENKIIKMSFIMKDENTDLNSINSFMQQLMNYPEFRESTEAKWQNWREWSNLGYMNVGTYKVSELVPMNYNLNRIRVSVTNINGEVTNYIYENSEDIHKSGNLEEAKVDIRSGVKKVKIVVENKKVNSNYWFDKAVRNNEFQLTK